MITKAQGIFRGKRVAVLAGGISSERNVSLVTANACADALRRKGYDVTVLDAGRDIAEKLIATKPDVVFNGLHGTYGEDGRIQGLLDWMGIPYTGESCRSSLLAMDKALSKLIFRQANLPIAEDEILTLAEIRSGARPNMALPLVLKPIAEGSSVGVSIVNTEEALTEALASATSDLLCEKFVQGVEISAVSMGQESLGSVEIAPKHEFYDYVAKYDEAGTEYFIPPRVDAKILKEAEELGVKAHIALGCKGITRTDIIISKDGPVILEVNTQPGMTSHSLVPQIAQSRGISFDDLVEIILDSAQNNAQ